jgi:rare lipoprotein A
MGRSRNLTIAAVLIFGAIAAPASTLAASGGAGLSTATPSATTATPSATAAAVANERVTFSDDGITVSSRTGVLLNGRLWLTGTVSSVQAGRKIVIEQQSSQTGSQWTQAGTAMTGSGGSFVTSWRPQQVGRASVRVMLAGSTRVSPAISVIVYRPSIATLFGPGLWGNHTACGGYLRKTTLGVANRKLPCGTQVAIYYRGRTVVVPVIDRGPYANHANWDLTMATGRAVGMNSTDTVGAMSLVALQK